MHYGREKQQKNECEWKHQEAHNGGHRCRAAQSQAGAREGREVVDVAPIQVQKAGEFVDDENFRGQARYQRPFPFGHDGLARAEDAESGVFARCEFAEELPACGGVGVIFYPINAASEICGCGLVAREQIEFHGFAVDLVEKRNERVK